MPEHRGVRVSDRRENRYAFQPGEDLAASKEARGRSKFRHGSLGNSEHVQQLRIPSELFKIQQTSARRIGKIWHVSSPACAPMREPTVHASKAKCTVFRTCLGLGVVLEHPCPFASA